MYNGTLSKLKTVKFGCVWNHLMSDFYIIWTATSLVNANGVEKIKQVMTVMYVCYWKLKLELRMRSKNTWFMYVDKETNKVILYTHQTLLTNLEFFLLHCLHVSNFIWLQRTNWFNWTNLNTLCEIIHDKLSFLCVVFYVCTVIRWHEKHKFGKGPSAWHSCLFGWNLLNGFREEDVNVRCLN